MKAQQRSRCRGRRDAEMNSRILVMSSAFRDSRASRCAVPTILSRPVRTFQRALALAALATLLACSDSSRAADLAHEVRAKIDALLATPGGSALGEPLAERDLLGQ